MRVLGGGWGRRLNPQAVGWAAVGTPDVAREVDAESQLLRDVLDAIRPDAGAPSARMRALWTGTLAFDNDRYGPLDAKHVQLALDGLAIYDRTQAPLEVTK